MKPVTSSLDLTSFGFTPTESLVYEVMIRHGPGTGYAIARSAGLARANAYSALEGLVQKGAARVEDGRPKRYRPEPPATLVARIVENHGRSLDRLNTALAEISVPPSPTLVELTSLRGTIQLLSHEIARAATTVLLVAPADSFPTLTPALRKAASAAVTLSLGSSRSIDLHFAQVAQIAGSIRWPGEPIVCVVDGRGAVLAARLDAADAVTGHWGTDPVLVAAAAGLFELFRG